MKTFSNTFSASIFYDVRWVDQDQFREYIVYDYFYGLSNQVVIFDIKTFIPYTDVLYESVFTLERKQLRDGFVTSYSESDFPDTYFSRLCGYLCGKMLPATRWTSTFQRLSRIWKQTGSCQIRFTCWIEAFSTCILSKNRDFGALCTTSRYLNKFIFDLLYFVSSTEYEIYDYQNALDEWNITILVYVGNNQFVDLTTWRDIHFPVRRKFWKNTKKRAYLFVWFRHVR